MFDKVHLPLRGSIADNQLFDTFRRIHPLEPELELMRPVWLMPWSVTGNIIPRGMARERAFSTTPGNGSSTMMSAIRSRFGTCVRHFDSIPGTSGAAFLCTNRYSRGTKCCKTMGAG